MVDMVNPARYEKSGNLDEPQTTYSKIIFRLSFKTALSECLVFLKFSIGENR